MIPTFTTWTMGPLDSGVCGPYLKSEKIGLSFPLTCVNAVRAIIEYIIIIIILCSKYQAIQTSDSIISIVIVITVIAILCGVVLPLILLWFIKRCTKCCCYDCCSKHCYPLTKISYLDPNEMDELKFIDQQNHKEDIEMLTVS